MIWNSEASEAEGKTNYGEGELDQVFCYGWSRGSALGGHSYSMTTTHTHFGEAIQSASLYVELLKFEQLT